MTWMFTPLGLLLTPNVRIAPRAITNRLTANLTSKVSTHARPLLSASESVVYALNALASTTVSGQEIWTGAWRGSNAKKCLGRGEGDADAPHRGRDHPSGPIAVTRRRHHQGRPRRLLHRDRFQNAAASQGPAADDAALPTRYRRAGLRAAGLRRRTTGLDELHRGREAGR